MTTRWRQKVTFISAVALIVIFLVLGIFVWTAISNGVFSSQNNIGRNRINISDNKSSDDDHTNSLPNRYKDKFSHHPSSSSPTSSSSSSSTWSSASSSWPSREIDPSELPSPQPPDIDFAALDLEGSNIEYVKPSKIHTQPLHADDLLYESKKLEVNNLGSPERHHITGHFRNKSSRIWDPHPEYEIDAFGLHMHLILSHDGNFMSEDIKVTHIWANETLRKKEDHKDHDRLKGCFYRGHVRGDDKSAVAVSLCDGMRGHIRTSRGSFFIQPVEKYTNENTNILHVVYRLPAKFHHTAIQNKDLDPTNCDLDTNNINNDNYPFNGESDISLSKEATTATFHVRRKRHSPPNVMTDNEYTMEVLVAVDKKMQEYHGDAIQSYVLTLMSIVSSIFADASIGNFINVAVVHILLLKKDLVVNSNPIGVSAHTMLAEFCKLKQKYNFQHDTALLLTREQICRSANQGKCDTLGLAELGTMCRTTSCSIVQDNGLSAAFTIAHELGHVLSMPHDDDTKCGMYHGTEKTRQFIMSRMLDHNTHPWSWSNCSRHFITEYLENNHGKCMLNKPKRDLIEPTSANSMLAGEKFTDDQQCELVFGPGTKICSYMPTCSSLWCSAGDSEVEGCRTQSMPWADGTTCGQNRWCQKAECVPRNRSALQPTDGGWGAWSPYGECSRTCGGGIQSTSRACDSPFPENGGKYCIGIRIKYRSCNTHDCPPDSLDAREEQCRELDNNNFDIPGLDRNVKWVPKYGVSPADECKLYCRVDKSNNYFILKDKVKDGTSCTHDSFNKCVNGICRPAGCDHELHSASKLDKCGICKGNNDTCMDVSGSFKNSQIIEGENNRSTYYYKVVRIPKGSSNIVILQPGYGDDHNYISLRDDQGLYLLNGNNLITQYPKTFPYAGITFEYNGAFSAVERINSTYARYLKRDLIVEVLSVRPMDRYISDDLIQFSYTMPKHINNHNSPIMPTHFHHHQHQQQQQQQHHQQHHYHNHHRNPSSHYQWQMSEWSECDKLCSGKKFRTAACIQMDVGLKVTLNLCHMHKKPDDQYEACNMECTLDWVPTKSNCSNICGEGVKTIKFSCIQQYRNGHSNIVDDAYCPTTPKPITFENCRGPCENAVWSYGGWEPCSQTCGGGLQNRTLNCLAYVGGYTIENHYCSHLPKEPTVRECNLEACPEWAYGEDSPCSVTCGEGKRTRVLYCKQNNVIVNSAICGKIPRPVTIINCTMEPCAKKISTVQVLSFYDDHEVRPIVRTKEIYNVHKHPEIAPYEKYEWRTGRWGLCSVSCGNGGKKIRTVKCALNTTSSEHEFVDDAYCDPDMRPINVTNCTNIRCPEWNFGVFSQCNDNCEKRRLVICQDHRGQVNDSFCPSQLKPAERESCCHFKWRTIWTPCSVSCGVGKRTRQKVCMKLLPKSKENPHPIKNGKQVDNVYCSHLKTPNFKSITKPCKKQCEFKWESSPWSACSAGCGTGLATRNVTCTNGRITSYSECDPNTKPIKIKQCDSRSHCQWHTKKWKTCSCGGYTKRRVVCVDTLRNIRSNSCSDFERPAHRQRCKPPPNCSCKGIQEQQGIRRDGEYILNVRGKPISIYCHNMNSPNPHEYVTLKAGSQENYSSYYDQRARDRSQCPDDSRDTFRDETIPAGTTRYSKVKINLHTLQVIEDDFGFAETSGHTQPFASAGDCFSLTEQCPQGVFSINFENTGFRIRPKTNWDTKGQNASMIFYKKLEPPYLKVIARCGGYCGNCFPSKNTTLHLDVV